MAEIKALFFDQDGVIVDTERNGHRVAFNRTFAEFGIDAVWDVDTYHDLLQVGGGKERMRHFFTERNGFADLTAGELGKKIGDLHARKTSMLVEMIRQGDLPLRPGVRRIMAEAAAHGLSIGICTTSNERTAQAIADVLLEGIPLEFILAGDVVSRKKPDPEIYSLAIDRAGITAAEAIVFEDSHIGTLAARRAGLNVVATVNEYTEREDMSNADLVVSSLGDPDEPARLIAPEGALTIERFVELESLIDFFGRRSEP